MCQPKFLPETPRSPENGQEGSKKRKTPSTSTNRTRVLTLEELQDNFHLPINEVACKLGVCVTVLKQQCRELGIVRWPYRKVRKLDNMLTALQCAGPSKARPFALTNGEEERQRKICTVKQTLKELISDPNSCAHLKLGKVKNAAAAATAATSGLQSECESKGMFHKLGLASHNNSVEEVVGEDCSDQAVFEAAQALVWGPESMRHSESTASRSNTHTLIAAQDRERDRDLLHMLNSSSPWETNEEAVREANGSTKDFHVGGGLGFTLGHSSSIDVRKSTKDRPSKDLKACWMQSFASSASTPAALPPHLGPLVLATPEEDQGMLLRLAPEGMDAGGGADEYETPSGSNSSFAGADADVDLGISMHGARSRSATVELDLISRLDSPKPLVGEATLNNPPDPEAQPNNPPVVPSAEEEASRSLTLCSRMAVPPVQVPSAMAIPAVGIPVPVPFRCALPCLSASSAAGAPSGTPGAPLTSANMLHLRNQHLALQQQQQQQQQLLSFLGYPPPHQIVPALLNSAVEAMNAQRHAFMTNQYMQLNPAVPTHRLQAPVVAEAVLPPKGASC